MTERTCSTCGVVGCGHTDARRCGSMFADWKPKPTMHQCPSCGWRIADKAFQQAKMDFDCPRCGESKLSEFAVSYKSSLA